MAINNDGNQPILPIGKASWKKMFHLLYDSMPEYHLMTPPVTRPQGTDEETHHERE